VQAEGIVTLRTVLDALEARYPMLRGTIRDRASQQRRPLIRFFACEQEPLMVVGAMAGGTHLQ
jgi:molybdopterin synthase sulfur carrier subunit